MNEVAHQTASVSLRLARGFTVAFAVALMFSPPVANLCQLILVGVIASSGELRGRLLRSLRQPLVLGSLAFFAMLAIGATYSMADTKESLGMLVGWRKLLLIPLCMALFDDLRSKLKLVHVFIGVAALASLFSYYGFFTQTPFPVPQPRFGVVIRNHATQGMFFGVAALAAMALVLFDAAQSIARRRLLIASALLLIVNVVVATPGRSGYVVLLASGLVLAAGWALGRRRAVATALASMTGAVAVMAIVFAVAPGPRLQIEQGIAEIKNHADSPHETSLGLRVHFWKNTWAMVQERPWFGVGTGGFQAAYAPRVAGKTGMAGKVISDPHNQFLKIVAEQGLVGLLVFLGFLACALAQKPGKLPRLLGLGVLAGWCGTSLASSHFSTFSEGNFIFLWLGCMLANEHETSAPT